MATIAVIGGTGYTGGNIVAEAAARGHSVLSFSRSVPAAPVAGVTYETGDATEAGRVIDGTDTVVLALSPRGALAGEVLGLYQSYAQAAATAGARLVVIGGFSSLRPAPDAPRFAEGDVPEQFRAEAHEMESVRAWLHGSAPEGLAWTFVSPAGGYVSVNPGSRTGAYRVGGEVALFDAEGKSEISGADFAIAVVDEVEKAAHLGEHISFAY